MPKFKRRATDGPACDRPHKVLKSHTANGAKDTDVRLQDLEHDIVLNTDILYEVLAQNNKYADYLEQRIRHERESREFWSELRKRLATAGIIGAFGLLGAALVYAAKEYMKNG